MKKIFLFLAFTFAINHFGFASEIVADNPQTIQEKTIPKKDCVMMIDGQMYVVKDGTKTEMNKAIVMANGTKVLANGEVYLKDGQSLKLANGDCVYMNGKIEKSKP